MYSKSLPLDIACRIWDVFFRDGDEFLFRTALGMLTLLAFLDPLSCVFDEIHEGSSLLCMPFQNPLGT